jgi:hypothetical protein
MIMNFTNKERVDQEISVSVGRLSGVNVASRSEYQGTSGQIIRVSGYQEESSDC